MNKIDLEKVKNEVFEILKNDDTGHDINHINRVLNLAMKFQKNTDANSDIVALIALLHDIDDYKLFGGYNANNLTNAKKILHKYKISKNYEKQVLKGLSEIGFSKRMQGIVPCTIESKIVSDADMCDLLGVNGILRTYNYSKKYNQPFFDKNVFPNINITSEEYKHNCSNSVCHIFEKVLKLKHLMLTSEGKKEANKRYQFIVNFLYILFEEEGAIDWINYLNEYLEKNNLN